MRSDSWAPETAARWPHAPRRVTIQAAILRTTSDEPGPGQVYALEARGCISTLRQREPSATVELRRCPAHKVVTRNEKTDEWVNPAADETGARGVEAQFWAEAKFTGEKCRYNRAIRSRDRSQTPFLPKQASSLPWGSTN